ncbi:MAG TPA: hypothetical protein VNK82_13740 [Terriglobales bacterium]|nr:hypothetical protein [Terriglobales bacterium]
MPVSDRREKLEAQLRALVAKRPDQDTFPGTGVLLNDAIEHYVKEFDLITPFDREKLLKPACYKLTIGDEFAINGQIHRISQAGESEIRIRPFGVAIIKTREVINLPTFLIGRWNIQVSKAYDGLLWLGGPQVDAGWVGHLFCPIYNLSDREVVLHHGDPIAVIDFAKTTEFHPEKSQRYLRKPGDLPDRILIEDYRPDRLKSALAEQSVSVFIDRINMMQSRIDTFISITFGVIALLFAAVTLLAGKPGFAWWDPSVFWICTIALGLSLAAWVRSGSPGRWRLAVQVAIALLVVGVLVTQAIRTQNQIDELRTRIEAIPGGKPEAPPSPSLPH